MSTKKLGIAALVLAAVLAGLVWKLMNAIAPLPTAAAPSTSVATTTSPSSTQGATTTTTEPLSSRVSVTSPEPNATVGDTFSVTGKAPGNWFFEAVFPIKITDADGNAIGSGQAHAQGEWMTTELVPFAATMTVSEYKGAATLVLLRDNPSGLPENDDAVSIPITIQ